MPLWEIRQITGGRGFRWDRVSLLFINVKKWKDKMPTYDKGSFDIRQHSLEEPAQVTCQSETVHEIIIAASFLPMIASVWFGALPVFIITSCVVAGIDLMYVFIQRFNRYRLMRIIITDEKIRNMPKE